MSLYVWVIWIICSTDSLKILINLGTKQGCFSNRWLHSSVVLNSMTKLKNLSVNSFFWELESEKILIIVHIWMIHLMRRSIQVEWRTQNKGWQLRILQIETSFNWAYWSGSLTRMLPFEKHLKFTSSMSHLLNWFVQNNDLFRNETLIFMLLVWICYSEIQLRHPPMHW